MIVGHYATALIPYGKRVHIPFWVLLLCSNFADFLWLALALAGIEAPTPSSMWEGTFAGLSVSMPWSHDLLPTLVLAALVIGTVWLKYRDRRGAFWCGALILIHLACDLVAGYEHQVAGPGTMSIGFDSYHRWPHLALIVEAVLGFFCVKWLVNRRVRENNSLTKMQVAGLYGVFVGGAIMWLPTATISLREIFSFAF